MLKGCQGALLCPAWLLTSPADAGTRTDAWLPSLGRTKLDSAGAGLCSQKAGREQRDPLFKV